MIDDGIETTLLRLRSVRFFIPALFGEVFYPNLSNSVYVFRHHVDANRRDTNIAAVK